MEIKYLNNKINTVTYGTEGSAAFDLQASIDDKVILWPGETIIIPSGISISINDKNIAALVMPRSGQSIHHLVVANSPGLIDSDYLGEIGIIAHNDGDSQIVINPRERIAQLMFVPVIFPVFRTVEEFSKKTDRGVNGFGHTG